MKDFAVFIAPVHGSTVVVSHGEVMYIDQNGIAELLFDDWDEKGESTFVKSGWLSAAAGGYISHHWQRVV